MPYPETEPTAAEIATNPALAVDLCKAFNKKPKEGIKQLKEICAKSGLTEDQQQQQLAKFFVANKGNLDLEAVGDYLSAPEPVSQGTLKHFTNEVAGEMRGVEFTQALRDYIGRFRLPGESQKIDRLVQAFGEAYIAQNPGTEIANKDAAYVLSFQAIMLATDAHNPSIKPENKMTFEGLKRNTKGINDGKDYSEKFLRSFYDGLTSKALDLTYLKTEPRFELESAKLGTDRTFAAVDKALGKKAFDSQKALGIDGAKATVAPPKPWHAFLTGYKSTVTITDKDGNQATLEVSKAGWFAGKGPSVTVKPGGDSDGNLKLAAQIASKFESPANPKATFDYERAEMNQQLQQQKQGQKAGVKTTGELEQRAGVSHGTGTKQGVDSRTVGVERTETGVPVDPEVRKHQEQMVGELGDVLAKRRQKLDEGEQAPTVGQSAGLSKVGEKQDGPGHDIRQGKGIGTSGR